MNRSHTELVVLVTPRIVDPVRGGVTAPKIPEFPMRFLDKESFDKQLPQPSKPSAAPAAKPEEAAKPQ